MALTPIPALPDTERRRAYSVTTTTPGPFNVGFDLYADGEDYTNWIEVYKNEVAVGGWVLNSPSGDLGDLPRPITNARITFNTALAGTVGTPIVLQIVGQRRPRRMVQAGTSPTSRDFNQAFTDIFATMREFFDRFNRVVQVAGGDAHSMAIPPVEQRANKQLGFDGAGNLTVTYAGSFRRDADQRRCWPGQRR